MHPELPLTARQQAILLAFLRQMVREREINLMPFIEAERADGGTLGLNSVLARSGQLLGRLNDRLATDEAVQEQRYLNTCFDKMETCELFFPGVTKITSAPDEDEKPTVVVGELAREFPGDNSRSALVVELRRWATRDPNYVPNPEDTIARVIDVLRVTYPVVAE